MNATALRVWRHPRPIGAEGRCIGAGTDLPVHWRKAKRLARRIQAHARRERLAHEVWTSPLQRCADVGRWLRRWGWRHHRCRALLELDFGDWDGQRWDSIGATAVDIWIADFVQHAPGHGENLLTLLQRAAAWHAAPRPQGGDTRLVVSHGGWMLARRWQQQHGTVLPDAAVWPRPPRYSECWQL
ncbi:histidine phosphatase family protein [Paucibacter sp. APW11]|uniref:Histidine phosphatase family protein n=1 Tax=Roseateles aquae TaxID=3077235 RepID=A0ABU3PC94_9BURK|nr:histidine phosphatase family protein [Paucibacter sp. APW11]MDT9000184.1 histidine phosphatase family protein [Paucibacter sp. APW11]